MSRERCVIEDKRLTPCAALERALEDDSKPARGLFPIEIFALAAGFVRSGAILRSGEFARRGIILNYCPFCGADIGSHLAAPSLEREEAQEWRSSPSRTTGP